MNRCLNPYFLCRWGKLFWVIVFGTMIPSLKAADGDWEQWSEILITQTFDYALEGNVRFMPTLGNDMSKFDYYEFESLINWKYSPRWDFAIGYERDEWLLPDSEIHDLATLATTLKVPMKDWKFINRFRTEWTVPESDEINWTLVYTNLTEVSMTWKLGSKELVPYISDEWFYSIQDGEFLENRLHVGVHVPIVPHWMADIYLMRLDTKTAQGWEWHPVLGVQIQARF